MPAVVAAIASAVSAAISAVGAQLLFSIVKIAFSFVMQAFSGKQRDAGRAPPGAGTFASDAQGRAQIIRASVEPRRVIYGEVRVSGVLVFAGLRPGNNVLDLLIALAGHECEEIGDVYLNDELITASKFSGYASATKFTGAWDQAAPDGLYQNYDELTTNHRARGTTYVWIALTWNRDVWPSGIPNVSAVVKGRKCYDPRDTPIAVTSVSQADPAVFGTGVHGLSAGDPVWVDGITGVTTSAGKTIRGEYRVNTVPTGTSLTLVDRTGTVLAVDDNSGADVSSAGIYLMEYSTNPAVQILDYLLSDDGLALAADEWNSASFIAAANACDEPVTLASGDTQVRYAGNGSFTLDKTPAEILGDMLTACQGALTYSGGQFRLWPAVEETAEIALTDDDLRGPIRYRPKPPRRDQFNAVRGTFVDPARSWQPNEFAMRTNSIYEAADGERIARDIEFPFTTDVVQAQRTAEIILRRSRQGLTADFPAKLTALNVIPGSVVTVTNTVLGWDAKEFRVMSWKLAINDRELGVDLVLQEETAVSYDWDAGEELTYDSAPNTSLPRISDAPDAPEGLALASGTDQLLRSGDGSVLSNILVSWTASTNAFVTSGGTVEIQRKKSSASDWATVGIHPGNIDAALIGPVEDGEEYDVRLRYRTVHGIAGDWATETDHEVVGKTELPASITQLRAEGGNLVILYSAPVDFAGFRIRKQEGSNTDWATAVAAHEGLWKNQSFPLADLGYGTATVLVKAEDTSGNQSQTAAALLLGLGDAPVANVVETVTFHTDWGGTLTGGTISTGQIFADLATGGAYIYQGNSAGKHYSGTAGQEIYTAPSYGQMVYEEQVTTPSGAGGSTVTIDAVIVSGGHTIEFRQVGTAPIYSGVSGADIYSGTAGAAIYLGGGAYGAWPGTITAAEDGVYDFRITTQASETQGNVQEFTVTFDVADKEDVIEDQVIAAAGDTTISLTNITNAVKQVAFNLQNDGNGAFSLRVTAKGPPLMVRAFDEGGNQVQALADLRVLGY